MHSSDVRPFVQLLRTRGYALVDLGGHCPAAEAVSEALASAADYFALPLEAKLVHKAPLFPFIGFVDNKRYHKQFFQLRRWAPSLFIGGQGLGEYIFDGTASSFQRAMDKCYTALHTVATSLAREVLVELGADEAYAASLLVEPATNDESFAGQLSSSNLSVFRYDGQQSAPALVSCPTHSDAGLLTVIPLQGQGSWQSLLVYDFVESKWMALEDQQRTPARTAVVFAGETMARLTPNILLGMHQVSSTTTTTTTTTTTLAANTPADAAAAPTACRFSVPFQLLAERYSVLRELGKGPDTAESITAGDFLDALSSSRASSNFLSTRGHN